MAAGVHKYDSVLVASYMRALAFEKGMVLNVTKTQKLLFLVYGYAVAEKGESPIKENPRAWPYGPVFPRTRSKVNFDAVQKPDDPVFTELRGDAYLNELIEFVLENFKNWSAQDLSKWSHRDGSPWHITTQQPGFDWNAVIDDSHIANYFKSDEFAVSQ